MAAGAWAATGADRVLATHGYTEVFSRWLRDQGYDAGILETEFSGDTEDTDNAA